MVQPLTEVLHVCSQLKGAGMMLLSQPFASLSQPAWQVIDPAAGIGQPPDIPAWTLAGALPHFSTPSFHTWPWCGIEGATAAPLCGISLKLLRLGDPTSQRHRSPEACTLQVQDLVETLRKVRFTKVDAGLRILAGPMTVKLNNLSAMECNLIRPFFAGALDRFYRLAKVGRSRGVKWQGGCCGAGAACTGVQSATFI